MGLITLASVLIGLEMLACGGTSSPSGSVPQTASIAAATGGRSPTPSADGSAARRFSGDYDEDDGYHHAVVGDGDDDDRHEPTDRDGDADSSRGSHHDSDDNSVRDFAHAATPKDKRKIVTLVKHYYTALITGDNTKACSLIYTPLAKSFPQTLGGAGPHYLHGLKTCSAIVSKVFRRNQPQLIAYAARLGVADVRVGGNLGLVLLSFKAYPEREIEVTREHGTWRMYALTDTEIP